MTTTLLKTPDENKVDLTQKPVMVNNLPNPVAHAPVAPSGAKPYTVQEGDSLGTIATKFGVPIQSITGYRSGDPNQIFPGETLTIGSPTGAQNIPPTQAPAITPEVKTFKTPSGATVSEKGDLIEEPKSEDELAYDAFMSTMFEGGLNEMPDNLSQYGFTPEALQAGFGTNPTKTVTDLVSEVMRATQLPDAKSAIDDLAKQIEEVSNQRDDELKAIDDDPFLSEGSKNQRKQQVEDKYDLKIKNRQTRLTLIQNAYDAARQEAQFAATTAIGLYDKNRNFDQGKLEFAMDSALKRFEAMRKLQEINPSEFKEVSGGLYNLRTREWVIPPSANGGKPPTSAQQTLSTYAERINQSNPILTDLEGTISKMSPVNFALQQNSPTAYLQNADMQKYMQASRNFINAILRRESGAVISPTEFAEANKQYLPQPGDTPDVLAQKKATRDLVEQNFIRGAGTAYQPFNPLEGAPTGSDLNEGDYSNAETAPVGSTVIINGTRYKKTGADAYEEL